MYWRDLPHLSSLPAFEAAGRLGSFKAAACELHVTPSAVSQQIKLLEELLGVALFERRGRAALLTKQGSTYLHEVRQALSSLAEASRRLRTGEAAKRNVLRISTVPIIAHELLLPRLPALRERFPALELRVEGTMECVDFSEDVADAAIRVGPTPAPGLTIDVLGPVMAAPVCSPACARDIQSVGDLARRAAIEVRGFPQHGIRAVLASPRRADAQPQPWTFETCLEAVRAAEQGLGVTHGFFPLLTAWVNAGRLAVPLPQRLRLPDVALVYPCGNAARFPLAELASWLRAEYAALAPLPEGCVPALQTVRTSSLGPASARAR
jgi:LysR family transcriptional regulator, glycine cleavage system transcriptional activator